MLPYVEKRDFADVIKDLEMTRLSWTGGGRGRAVPVVIIGILIKGRQEIRGQKAM